MRMVSPSNPSFFPCRPLHHIPPSPSPFSGSHENLTNAPSEITAKFATLLTSVQTHLTSKLALYASLNARCATQMKEIEESKEELGRVRRDMESGAGGVVGVGLIDGRSAARIQSEE